MRRNIYLVLFSLVLAACGSSDDGKPGPDPVLPVVVSEDVRVLSVGTLESLRGFDLDLTTGAGELRFQAGDPALAGIKPGLILAAEPVAGAAPHGFLQRIESSYEEGGEIVFVTRQATLEETFEEADIVHEVQLRPEHLTSTQALYQGVSIQGLSSDRSGLSESAAYDFAIDFDEVLIDLDGDEETVDDQLQINGAFKFGVGVEAKIKIGTKYLVVPTLEHLKFVAFLNESVDLELKGTLALEFDEEVEVARFAFGSIVVPVGPVPVVFAIDMKVIVGASGKLEARLVATAAQALKISVGAEYKADGGWSNLSGFESDFDFPTPEITAAASARAFARPELGIKIYGLAGPAVAATAFVEVDAELGRDPFWNLVAGVDLGVVFEAELPVIGKLGKWQDDFELFRMTLDTSPNEAPRLELLSLQDGARLEEGAALVFDVRVTDREQGTVPVVLKADGVVVHEVVATGNTPVKLSAGRACPGSHRYEIVATDENGAETKKAVNVVVDNGVPAVTIRTDLLEGRPTFAGGVLVAVAQAFDTSCTSDGNAAQQDLIKWFIDGSPVGETDTLIHMLPRTLEEGAVIRLQAKYDDGTEVASSAEVSLEISARDPNVDYPPVAMMVSPKDGDTFHATTDYPLTAVAFDAEDGLLTGSSVVWEFQDGDSWIRLPAGQTTFNLVDIYGSRIIFNWARVRVVATDGAGQTDAMEASIHAWIAN